MQRRGHELLTGSGLSEHEHGEVGRGDGLHLIDDLPDRSARPHLNVELAATRSDLTPKLLDLRDESACLYGPPDRDANLVGIERLRNIVEGTHLDRLHSRPNLVAAGQHDDGKPWPLRL